MAIAVKELDDELTEQRIELTLHGAAIKELLEARNRERDHNWQLRIMAATIVTTNILQDVFQVVATLSRKH